MMKTARKFEHLVIRVIIAGLFLTFTGCQTEEIIAPPEPLAGTHLWISSATGAGSRQLTFSGSNSDPTWNPEGTSILFVSWGGFPEARGSGLWEISPEGGEARLVISVETHKGVLGEGEFRFHYPKWSPDGTKIAFLGERQSFRSLEQNIFIFDVTINQLSQITSFVATSWEPELFSAPSWFPDGKSLVFSRGDSVFVISVKGGTPTFLMRGRGPVLSPSGSMFAVVQDGWLNLVDTSKTLIRRSLGAMESFFEFYSVDDLPIITWSPDEKYLAVGLPSDRLADIWIVDTDTGEKRLFMRSGVYPAWSPDGSQIAFVKPFQP